MWSRVLPFAALVALLCAGGVRAQTTLPPPRVVPPAVYSVPPRMPPDGRFVAPMPLPSVFYRPSAYRVWQNYGRTYSGTFRPLVIDAPGGAYYYYRGIPYPWVHGYQTEFIMPLIRD